jgi:hypothetical protein
VVRSPAHRWRRAGAGVAVGVLSITGMVLGDGRVARAAPENVVYVVQTQGSPLEVGVSIPLRVGVKIGGTEAAVDDAPSARGAAMLVDSRGTGLVGLLLFGTTADPPVKLPTPTVAESFWADGDTAQRADASFVTDPAGQQNEAAPSDGRVFRSVARAEPGPWSMGQASYAGFDLPALGLAVSGMASESVADAKGDTVAATTRSVVKRLSLLDDQIILEDIVATASGAADGTGKGLRAQGTFAVGRVTAFGTPTELTTEGLAGASPALDQLRQQGVSIRLGHKEEVLDEVNSHATAVSRGVVIRFQPPGAEQAIDFTVGFASVDISAPPRPTFADLPAVPVAEERRDGTTPRAGPASATAGPGSSSRPSVSSDSSVPTVAPASPEPPAAQPATVGSFPEPFHGESGTGTGPVISPSSPTDESPLASREYRASSASERRSSGGAATETELLAMVLAAAGVGGTVVLNGLRYAVRVRGPR